MTSKPVPPVLKPVTQFVQRGRELMRARADEAVAYHCFRHAMDIGLKLNDKTPECEGFLMDLMTDLETMKPHLAGRSSEELRQTCEAYAKGVLQRAEDQNEAGAISKQLAQTYYAASTFFEILKQFDPSGQLDPDTKQLVIYSKFKANEILKGLQGYEASSEAPAAPKSASPPPTSTPAALPPKDDIPIARPSNASVVAPPPELRSKPAPLGRAVNSLSKTRKADCLEYIKFARAALEADDVALTIERLQSALSLLHDG